MAVQPSPDGYHTVTPYLRCRGANEALEFYKRAFGAEEVVRMPGPDGKLMHGEIRIGDSFIMLGEENLAWHMPSPTSLGGSGSGVHLYVPDADAAFARAVAAGAKVTMPLEDAFWGDRYGKLVDPFGHEWSIATHVEDVTPEQIRERMAAMFAGAS